MAETFTAEQLEQQAIEADYDASVPLCDLGKRYGDPERVAAMLRYAALLQRRTDLLTKYIDEVGEVSVDSVRVALGWPENQFREKQP